MKTLGGDSRNNLTLLSLIAVVFVAVISLGYQIFEDTRQTSSEDLREIRKQMIGINAAAAQVKSDLRILKADVERLENKVDTILERLGRRDIGNPP